MNPIGIAIHGGAGTITRSQMTPEKERAYLDALLASRDRAYQILTDGGTSLDAVTVAVSMLEDCPLFNAGRGSVFSANGTHEMDASIMNGANLKAGAVSLIHNIRNPIKLARDVMERSEHVFLAGAGAMEFATNMGYEMVDDSYFFDQYRYNQWQQIKDSDTFKLDHSDLEVRKFGTVGAVALDLEGNLAAATSTGGMTNKKYGRIGDTPIIGAGTYADNGTCAVSCTGSGEFFIRAVVAYDVACGIRYCGWPLAEAARHTVNQRLSAIGGDGGLIAIDPQGNIVMEFNTEGMYRAAINNKGVDMVNIYK